MENKEQALKEIQDRIDAAVKNSNAQLEQSLQKELEAIKAQAAAAVKSEDVTKIEKRLNDYIKASDEALIELKAKTENATSTGTGNAIYEVLKANADKLKSFKDAKTGKLELVTKATHTSTDIVTRSDWSTWHEGGRVGQIPVRKPFLRELFRSVASNTEYIKYVDQNTVVRDAKNVALCGATTHNTKVTFQTYDMKVEKVRDFTHICHDMLDDYSFVEGEIRNLLNSSLALFIDGKLLSGTGTSPELHSIEEIASTFSAAGTNDETDYEDTVVNATIIDLLSVAAAQIRSFGANNAFNPNVILLNPKDAQLMKLLKDGDNNYIKPNSLKSSLVMNNGVWYIDGMIVIENSGVAANEAYIFDSTKGTVYTRPGVGVEFSYENRENFETETVTAKVYERLNLLIRNVDANAFMHIADIEQGIADIDTVAT
jgi:HK97 family phage major capsid protein